MSHRDETIPKNLVQGLLGVVTVLAAAGVSASLYYLSDVFTISSVIVVASVPGAIVGAIGIAGILYSEYAM